MASELDEDAKDAQCAGEATAWFLRLKDPGVTEKDRKAFRRWLAEDLRHHQAFNEIARLWSDLETPAAILGEGRWYRKKTRRGRRVSRRALAASTLIVVGAAAALLSLWRDAGLIDRLRADYATPPGERRSIMLADGSRVVMDGDTALKVNLSSMGRRIDLLRGRAWFDVVHDASHPFEVDIDAARVRDIGTAFAIDRRPDGTSVVVEKGSVIVSLGIKPEVKLSAGEQTLAAKDALKPVTRVNSEALLAWRRGLIILDQAPLRLVMEELERMKPGRVVFIDKSLEDLTLSGVFRADDPAAIVEALRTALNLRTISVPGFATLIYR